MLPLKENACFQTLYVLFPVLRTVSVLRAVMPAPTANTHYLIPEMKIEKPSPHGGGGGGGPPRAAENRLKNRKKPLPPLLFVFVLVFVLVLVFVFVFVFILPFFGFQKKRWVFLGFPFGEKQATSSPDDRLQSG